MSELERSQPERRRRLPKTEKSKTPNPLDGVLSDFDFIETSTSFQGGPPQIAKGRLAMAWSMTATMIDALVVLSLACLFFASFLLIERMHATEYQLERDVLLQAGALIFCFLHGAYLILLRIFLGNSLGEWACGLRLGIPRQRFSSKYSFLVLLRFTIVLGTGVVVLPVLSLLSGVDWAGKLSGLPLVILEKNGGGKL